MGGMSIWHWLMTCLWLAAILVPAWHIAARAGYHGAWSLLLVVPVVNLVLIWFFAFARWPNERPSA